MQIYINYINSSYIINLYIKMSAHFIS